MLNTDKYTDQETSPLVFLCNLVYAERKKSFKCVSVSDGAVSLVSDKALS